MSALSPVSAVATQIRSCQSSMTPAMSLASPGITVQFSILLSTARLLAHRRSRADLAAHVAAAAWGEPLLLPLLDEELHQLLLL